MIDLILAVVSSMLVSVIMRVSEKHIHNNISMLASNYLMCTVMAVVCVGTWNLFPVSADGFSFSVGLGLISGVFYMSSFMLLQWNTKKNGIVLSSMFMKLGVMVPTLMAIVVFHEKPKMVQVLGMMFAVAAILLINMEKGSARAASSAGLVFLLIAGGMTDGMAKIYEELGVGALKNHFLLYTFIVAFVMCVAVCLLKKQGLTKADLGFGLLIGIPNYGSALFLLRSLSSIPAMIAYPTYSVASIVLVTLTGVMVFKEKLSHRQGVSMMIIFAALVLLNI